MSQEEIVKRLSRLIRALDTDVILSSSCYFMLRVSRTMLEIARSEKNDVSNSKPTSAFLPDESDNEYEPAERVRQDTYHIRMKLCQILANFYVFVEIYLKVDFKKKLAGNKLNKRKKNISYSSEKLKYLTYTWSLLHLDAIHSKFSVYALNTFVLFLNSFKEKTPLLPYSKDLVSLISLKDPKDEQLKKDCNKLSSKLLKFNLVSTSLSKSAFIVQFTTSVSNEYYLEPQIMSQKNLLYSFQQMKLVNSASDSILGLHKFNYKNRMFLNKLLTDINSKIMNELKYLKFESFDSRFKSSKPFNKIITDRLFDVSPADSNMSTFNITSKHWFNLNLVMKNNQNGKRHKTLSNEYIKVVKAKKVDHLIILRELDYFEKYKGEVLLFPLSFTATTYFKDRLFLFYSGIKTTLADIMFNGESRYYRFNEYESLLVVYEIVQSLLHLHKHGLFHGKLTPSSIAITDRNVLKLFACDELIATQDIAKNTDFFEHIFAPANELKSEYSDIYSIGILMFLMLHSEEKLSKVTENFIYYKDKTIMPTTNDMKMSWSKSLARGKRPKTSVDAFVVDRPLRVQLVDEVTKYWSDEKEERPSIEDISNLLETLLEKNLTAVEERKAMLSFVYKCLEEEVVENRPVNEKYRKLNLSKNRQSVKQFREPPIRKQTSLDELKRRSKPQVRLLRQYETPGATKSTMSIFSRKSRRNNRNTGATNRNRSNTRPLSTGSTATHISRGSKRGKGKELKRDGFGTKSMLFRTRKKKKEKTIKQKELQRKKSIQLDEIEDNVERNEEGNNLYQMVEEFEEEEVERLSRTFRARKNSGQYLQEIFDEVEADLTKQQQQQQTPRIVKKKRESFTKSLFKKKKN